jgi:hypothetical protein
MKVGSSSRYERRISEIERLKFSGQTGEIRYVKCKILMVYDHASDPPDALREKRVTHPGVIYADVIASDRSRYTLPLVQSAEEVYSLYGNSELLVGALGKIEYKDNAISEGRIRLVSNPYAKVESYEDTNFVASISDIVGNL